LIYQSTPLREGDVKPYCMLFEVVEGARLTGHADPGAVVQVSLGLRPRLGQGFTFSARAKANPAGAYTVRLPYPNEPFSPDVESADHYTVRVGKESATVVVSEAAVSEGLEVAGPTFRQ